MSLEPSHLVTGPEPPREVRRPAAYTVDVADDGDVFLIRLRGELGAEGFQRLETELDLAESSPALLILLDVNELTSLDADGLRVILEASRRSNQDGDRLRLTRGRGHVADLFRLTALDHTIRFTNG